LRDEPILVVNAIITCIGYDDFLQITLPRTLEHFERVVVLTSAEDERTQRVCAQSRKRHGSPSCVITSEFGTNTSVNKGAAIDAGLRWLGPRGWICILDADVYLPKQMDLDGIQVGCIYSPHRRLMEVPGPIPPDDEWAYLFEGGPEHRNGEYGGYFQLFHASDPHFTGPPWYRTREWETFQGSDTVFWRRWMPNGMRRLPFEVLHLGSPRLNWRGRITDRWTK
jgi:hypothetical protein